MRIKLQKRQYLIETKWYFIRLISRTQKYWKMKLNWKNIIFSEKTKYCGSYRVFIRKCANIKCHLIRIKTRSWVYISIFKNRQNTMNWHKIFTLITLQNIYWKVIESCKLF